MKTMKMPPKKACAFSAVIFSFSPDALGIRQAAERRPARKSAELFFSLLILQWHIVYYTHAALSAGRGPREVFPRSGCLRGEPPPYPAATPARKSKTLPFSFSILQRHIFPSMHIAFSAGRGPGEDFPGSGCLRGETPQALSRQIFRKGCCNSGENSLLYRSKSM